MRVSVEIGILSPPWPGWLAMEDLGSSICVVDVGHRILSSNINDGLPADAASALILGILEETDLLHAWLHTDMPYRMRVLEALGMRPFMAISAFERHSVADGLYRVEAKLEFTLRTNENQLLAGSPGYAALCYTHADLGEVGLPTTFLTPVGWDDRIGLSARPDSVVEYAMMPTLADMLKTYELVVFPGGDHHTECLFASLSLDSDALALRIRRVCESLGWETWYLGVISGQRYEDMYQRSL